ncbi:hypothetical protein BDN70DRAFT_885150 [Pholiota conissans]|uniref:Uncharacterized protein n=1 Tax=Pholiota conissans TaxID=109636 RepID=A0A9P5YQT4_9AGAR|nr:hypothetical protein BDN70DRAFT_885150 [Pholiota conissans]
MGVGHLRFGYMDSGVERHSSIGQFMTCRSVIMDLLHCNVHGTLHVLFIAGYTSEFGLDVQSIHENPSLCCILFVESQN